MGSVDTDRMYMCIDLKSFYASVECADLGLDPFTTPLVVADGSRGKGAITLAISPALKKLGVKNRSRLFEIPPHIEYLTVKPHMKRYMQASAEIYGILLKYVAPEDVHVYSIDEYFIDITPYLPLYKKTPRELAQMLLDAVLEATKIYATVGIGTNLFLAKVALDILAKYAPDFIGYLDESLFKEKIWYHQPLTDIWQIGKGIANRYINMELMICMASPWFQRPSCTRNLVLMQSSLSIMLGAVSRVRLQISMRIVLLSILSRIARFCCVIIPMKRPTCLCGKWWSPWY